jgi:hypothetical protein
LRGVQVYMGLPTMLTPITIEICQALECLPERLLRGSSNPQYLCNSGCSSHTSPP